MLHYLCSNVNRYVCANCRCIQPQYPYDGHVRLGYKPHAVRYAADLRELEKRYEFDGDWLTLEPAYNIAPTQDILTVVGYETRRIGFMRWS